MLFKDDYFFLSNFYPCDVSLNINGNNLTFKNSEAAFQAQKNYELADKFIFMKGLEAKDYGNKIPITTPNWKEYELFAMAFALNSKFSNAALFLKLKSITETIQNTNNWYDRYWGICKGEGKDLLGKLLTNIKENNNNLNCLINYIQNDLLKEIQ